MTERRYNVLFLRTGNSVCSIIAECVLRREGGVRFEAYSAGSKGEIHPHALDLLRNRNFPVDSLRSRDWEEFAAPVAPSMDFVFTVNAAQETCPAWPGQPMSAGEFPTRPPSRGRKPSDGRLSPTACAC